jgi:asparagine synthase (glutamine-hydrolysing)
MTKLCGVVSTGLSQQRAETYVQSMLQVMKHTPAATEACVGFEDGAIGVISNPASDPAPVQWDTEQQACLALCGHIVDRTNGQGAPEQDRAVPAYDTARWLLESFEKDGEHLLQNLNGVFAFAHYNSASCCLTIVNDRYGFMPLYYYCDEQMLVFASEVKAILQVIEQPEFDWESWADFFYIGHLMGQKTLFKHVQALQAGQVLTYGNGELHQRQYYDFTQTAVLPPQDVSTEKVAALFTEAVRRRVQPDCPNTLLLSGGFDSRLILGALQMLGVTPKLLTLGHANYHGGEDGQFAVEMAHTLGLAVDFRPTRPQFSSSTESLEVFYILDGAVPTWELFIGQVYSELDPSLDRVWDGLALDVPLGGAHQNVDMQANLKHFLAKRGLHRLLLRLILTPHYFRLMDSTFQHRLQQELAQIPVSENQFLYFLLKHRTRRRIAGNPYQLYATKVKPMTPAADVDFLEYVLGIPSRLKVNHRFYIQLLQEAFPFLTKVPIHSGGDLFHFDQPAKSKQRNTPKRGIKGIMRRMFRGCRWILRNYLQRNERPADVQAAACLIIPVLERKYFDRPFYNKKMLRRLFAAYRNGNMVYHPLFTLVFYIELWHLLFVDKDSSMLFQPHALHMSDNEPAHE